ncbi:hypothetical protein M7I_7056 [Glarea lozoyensis 74030]|uniref:Uncharacterized protein n=1 Tax=Glarea lozoyensis (strain ATCC 74030 / MF5533) TaxID=1104152 RepID=H0EW94_GLAL7|nr:hypothetical protein M7I_7056 [Glarea lozoyensis 74030]
MWLQAVLSGLGKRMNNLTPQEIESFYTLNVARATRVTVMVLFGLRLVVSLLAIVELISVANSLASPDQSWVSLSRFIWMMLKSLA